jgi:hypothetical protein
MSGAIFRRSKPEEEELARKRAELATLRGILADRELELVDLRSQLAIFEGRYLRQVGTLYAELDDWKARISELQAELEPSDSATDRAREAREQAGRTNEHVHGIESKAADFTPSPDLKRLFREVAKRVHPDFSKDSADLERRTRLMAEANRAYQANNTEVLQQILDEWQDGGDSMEGEGIGAELIRIIRQISQSRDRLSVIEKELVDLKDSEIAKLQRQAEDSNHKGRDLLAELAADIKQRIALAKGEYEVLSRAGKPRER